jgi:tRNA-uridine 2-sulfurtransferase
MDLRDAAGKRIFVGMSGGVDSSVTAALLKRAGADVTGVFIKGWYPPGFPCTWSADRRDAMRAAAHLGIGFRTLEAGEEYKKGVIDYLIREYRAGRTPNPDIMCNREVKFGAFHTYAMREGADFIATGHYARVNHSEHSPRLQRGIDESKDQSYFLWNVPADALRSTLFPLGGMRKEEVRKLALEFKLPNARKKDSQGICFLGSLSVHDFLRAELGTATGKAVDGSGKEVGRHEGAVLYTLGERVALANALPGPWYVLAKDLEDNVLTVGKERVAPTRSTEMELIDANWFSGTTPTSSLEAQYRYHGPRISGKLDADGTYFIPDTAPDGPIASGQSLVLYEQDACLGGAIIA